MTVGKRPWDYVVVGAGSAGAVVASRLSEDPDVRVLVLEGGPDWVRDKDDLAAVRWPERIDEITSDLATYGRIQWSAIPARRTSLQSFRPYRQGAGLGGSSLINGIVALRPPLADFDAWARDGCTGWSAKEILPSFVRLEDDGDFADAPYHGRGGPVPIWRAEPSQWGPLDHAFHRAAEAMGHRGFPDQNEPEPRGVGAYPANLRDGRRVTSYDSYLAAAGDRSNLVIQGASLVDRLLFDSRAHIAGIRFAQDGEMRDVECHEVVLCAGAVGSPAILLRSGIGPPDDLRELDIDVLVESDVGRRLQDHPMLAVNLEDAGFTTDVAGRGYEVVLRAGTGIDGDVSSEFAVHPVHTGSGPSTTTALFVFLHRCDSRGSLRLRSRDPAIPPELDERMLSDPRDLGRMRVATRHTIELARHLGLRSARARIGSTGDRDSEDLTVDRKLDAMLLRHVTDAKHVSATCPMGRVGDRGVVVDSQARVIGVRGVRVADCSIVPTVPRANTYLTAIMIGERVADLIRTNGVPDPATAARRLDMSA